MDGQNRPKLGAVSKDLGDLTISTQSKRLISIATLTSSLPADDFAVIQRLKARLPWRLHDQRRSAPLFERSCRSLSSWRSNSKCQLSGLFNRAFLNPKNMKTKMINIVAVSAAMFVGTNTSAAPPESAKAAEKAIKTVSSLELPAKAAELIARAPVGERNAVAAAILRAVNQSNPGAVPTVIGTLRRTDPGLAAVAAHSSISRTPNANSRFGEAPPHGGTPPGRNGQPGRKGPPGFVVDYSKPREL